MSDVNELVAAMAKAMHAALLEEGAGDGHVSEYCDPETTIDGNFRLPYLARAALAAIEPTGKWRIVPVEPTEEMRRAASGRRFEDGWYALLDAAPKVTPSDTP